jgi:multidrug efflux system outer membrane protein
MTRRVLALVAALAVSGCATTQPYQKPVVATPDAFRGAGDGQAGVTGLGDLKWWDVFQDAELQTLIRTALAENQDVKIAAARIVGAEAQVAIVHADELPGVSGAASAGGQRTPAHDTTAAQTAAAILVEGQASWQIDFWGRYRRATDAARAQLVASHWAERAVTASLVSDVADAYFGLRALDLELDIAERTRTTRQQSLDLTRIREQGGATSLLDVRQAEQLVIQADATIVELQRRIEQQENLISVLLGRAPAAITRGRALIDQPHPPEVPAGLPASLLGRRPDIQEAEQQIVVATAGVGIAEAAKYPNLALTGAGGLASAALAALVSGGGAVLWSAGASLVQPIFTGGRTQAQIQAAEARRQEATLGYERAVNEALREVSDGLSDYRRRRELREQQERLFTAAQDARRLSDLRYQGGATSYLEVLDADTRLFIAELGLADARLSEMTSLVGVYRALGGGW